VCGRYTNTGRKRDAFHTRMADLLRAAQPRSDHGYERYNIAPTQEVLVVIAGDGERRMEHVRWGLPGPRSVLINARAESLHERPAYRNLVADSRHRCLVVADGWYEWQRAEDPALGPRPLHYTRPRREPFCFAGLWRDGDDSACTIVTCEANELARPVHDRMPAVLTNVPEWDAWLDPALDGTAAAELLRPLPSERLTVRPAHPVVNSSTSEGPECLAEPPPVQAAQLRLTDLPVQSRSGFG